MSDFDRRQALTLLGGAAVASALPACRTQRALDADVIVIGAGLAGLYTAMLLEDSGRSVQVVEASARIGGRMFTLDHADGFTEGGGQQIGASYARLLDVAEQLDVPLYTQSGPPAATSYYLDGDWQSADALDIEAFPDAFRNTPPASVLFRLIAREPALESADAWLDAPESFDISAAQFLAERGFDAPARALIDRALNANSLDSYSMLNLHRTMQLYRQSSGMGPTRYVEGGSQRLPEAMAASLSRPVKSNWPVSAIRQGEDRIVVTTPSGQTLHAAHAVAAVPFPVLRNMTVNAPLSETQREAVAALPYTQIAQTHFRVTTPYYDRDGLAANMWTDTEYERLFHDTDRDGAPTGFLRNWRNGDGTRTDMNMAGLAALRPSLDGALEWLATVDWTTANTLAGGAYYHWAPGQAARWARTMGQPAGRLYFAGEHLGLLHTGMEAAMESAERTALSLLEDA